jgi:hypothetical protein
MFHSTVTNWVVLPESAVQYCLTYTISWAKFGGIWMRKLYHITPRKINLVNCASQLISNCQRVVFIRTGCYLFGFVAAAPSKQEIPPRASIVLGLYCRLWKLIHTPPQPRFLHGRGMQSAVDDPKLQRIRHVVIDSLARSPRGPPNNQTILEGQFMRPLLGGHGCNHIRPTAGARLRRRPYRRILAALVPATALFSVCHPL